MKIVIDIDKNLYEGIERRNGALETEYVYDELMKAIDNGTILPKGHGRLIDADDVTDFEGHYITTDAPTIIEADKENE